MANPIAINFLIKPTIGDLLTFIFLSVFNFSTLILSNFTSYHLSLSIIQMKNKVKNIQIKKCKINIIIKILNFFHNKC